MTQWRDRFGRSSYGKAVWFDRDGLGSRSIGAPEQKLGGSLFSGGGNAQRFADGQTTFYAHYTWSDANDRGHRVAGWATLRFVCHINGIDPPTRRLFGEPFLPEPELVAEAVIIQLATMRDTLAGPNPSPESREPMAIDELPGQAKAFWELLAKLHGR